MKNRLPQRKHFFYVLLVLLQLVCARLHLRFAVRGQRTALQQLPEQDNFFFSGGSSAQIPRLLAMIADTFGRTIHATDILNAPTVVRLVKEVFAEQKEENQTDDVLEDIDILDI